MKLYNSLTRQIETFKPRQGNRVGVYTCGPTVYDTAHIGNFRTYTLADILIRTLRYLNYQVTYVMNLTDVGHLTGDNQGDPSVGEDRLEKGARREGLSAWDIANKYAQEFIDHMNQLNLTKPDYLVKATEHIEDQINLIKDLEKRGLTYRTSDGIYFDVQKFESLGYQYGQLSTLDQRKGGARVKLNPEKKDIRDFALWKFSPKNVKRQMEWDSPWGVGFPGWHIECSAMSMRYLGSQFDIHIGGEDLRSTHHPNEIAQSEGATGKKPFVRYWVHIAFLLVDGGRMGKSLGNAYTLNDLNQKGFDPLALRYFYLTGHYRKQENFTWQALEASAKALKRLRNFYQTLPQNPSPPKDKTWLSRFRSALADDLNTPEALAVVWEVTKDDHLSNQDKSWLLTNFDQVLGLKLNQSPHTSLQKLPTHIQKLIQKRNQLRKAKRYQEADEIRLQLQQLGYELKDQGQQTVVEYKP